MEKGHIILKGKKSFFLVSGFLIIIAMILSGYRAKNLSKEKEENMPVIIVGCNDYTPFSYMDMNGHITGIDVELATEAFSRIGYEARFKFINWEEKKDLLQKRRIDCIWSSFTMDGREKDYKWAGPYMKSNQVVAVNIDSDITSLKDLKGKTIAVQSTTKPEDLLRSHSKKIPQVRKVISVKNRDLIYTFMSKGYVDALAAHDTSIDQFMEVFDMEFRILDEPLLSVGLGVAFDLEDNREIDTELSKTLKNMQKDGTVKKIVSKYLSDSDKYLEDVNEK